MLLSYIGWGATCVPENAFIPWLSVMGSGTTLKDLRATPSNIASRIQERSPGNFFNIPIHLSTCPATDPKDMVYGVLALIKRNVSDTSPLQSMEVDYRLSTAEVPADNSLKVSASCFATKVNSSFSMIECNEEKVLEDCQPTATELLHAFDTACRISRGYTAYEETIVQWAADDMATIAKTKQYVKTLGSAIGTKEWLVWDACE